MTLARMVLDSYKFLIYRQKKSVRTKVWHHMFASFRKYYILWCWHSDYLSSIYNSFVVITVKQNYITNYICLQFLCSRYDVELYQRIEKLIGKKLPLHPMVDEEVMLLVERVTEAQRYAKIVSEDLIELNLYP